MSSRSVLCTAACALVAVAAARARVVTIDFENYPGPDGRLGTPDDVPIIAPDSFGDQHTQLTTEFESVGVRFLPIPPVEEANEVLTSPFGGNWLRGFFHSIQGEFVTPVSSFSAELFHAGFNDQLEALRADGSVITFVDSAAPGVYTLSADEPIYGFRQSTGSSPPQAWLDNLSFTPIPAPGAGAIAGAGALLAGRRRRQ